MKITIIGNCVNKALTWYIQQLNKDFDVKYIWTIPGVSKDDFFKNKLAPTITNTNEAKKRLSDSDFIIYHPIQPTRVKYFNYKDIKKYETENCKLIPIGVFFLDRSDPSRDNTQSTCKYLKKRGLLGIKERAEKHNMEIKIHKIIEKYEPDELTTNNSYHPKVLFILELVREICKLTGWQFYSEEQYDQYITTKYPFG